MSERTIADLERWLQTAAERLSPAQQKKIIREISAELAKRNRKRMTAQKSPQGTSWQARKKQQSHEDDRPAQSGRGRRNPHPQKGNPPLRFRYHGRTISLKNYRKHGGRVVGFDPSSGKVKSFIVGEKTSKAKGKKMMRSLKKRAHFTIRSKLEESRIGWFKGQDVKIARIHHYGKSQQLKRGKADYPERPLIGLTEEDRQYIKEALIAAVAQATEV